MKRRRLIAAVPGIIMARPNLAVGQSTELQESDPAAVPFEYKADASKVDPRKSPKYKPGQTCSTCSLFFPQPASAAGGCQLFYGKDVAAIGWCNAWESKSP